jgi:uncharacterized membrane protein YkvA (DUF1232 family)
MADPAGQMERMKAWIDSFASDVAALQSLLADERAASEARLHAAGALNYLLLRMDLIPDWEETCGIIDDAMILRVSMSLVLEMDLGAQSGENLRIIGKLANEAERVHEFLGDEIYARLKKYAEELARTAVRGRHPRILLDDPRERKRFFDEIKDDLKRLPTAPMSDPGRVARVVKNTLAAKLK